MNSNTNQKYIFITMRKSLFSLVALLGLNWGIATSADAAAAAPEWRVAGDEKSLYDLLDLDRPGLKAVKKAVAKGDIAAADQELLKYFRNRKKVSIYGLDPEDITLTDEEQMMADQSLEHKFYAHKGYQPSSFYGDDIDWRYWPVKDNELRWQLHRHYWFIPLAKAYKLTHDEKYVEAWIEHYTDWIRKNPIDGVEQLQAAGASDEAIAAEKENFRFAWRPMEAGRRLQDQLTEFELTIASPHFTADFLNLFLRMFHQHADYVLHRYSEKGNHLLFEAQRMLFAGIYFPEFRDAKSWRESGIEILNREIGVQVYPDGMQFELDFGYHIAAIDIFLKALGMAHINGMAKEFPSEYIATVEKMTVVTYNLLFPDNTNPMFGDTKQHNRSTLKRQFAAWGEVFPANSQLPWIASDKKEGEMPYYTSRAFKDSGFYVLRNGWDKNATVTIVKAGPPAFWHNQPDNGTFEYWHRGRNFFPDSGSYVYGGDSTVLAQRDWFRQTRVHNTLTLDNRNLEKTESKLLLWKTKGQQTLCVTENPSYEGLTHRRAMFFMEDGVLVIADQTFGTAEGTVGVHFNLCPGEVSYDANGLRTLFEKGSNIRIRTICDAPMTITREEGWVSKTYRKKEKRPAYAAEARKGADESRLFITVIAPVTKSTTDKIEIATPQQATDRALRFTVEVDGRKYDLGYDL